MRQCKYCKREEAVYRGEKKGFRPYCKSCRPVHELIVRYGLTEEDAIKQFKTVNCMICYVTLERNHRTSKSKRIDHCHRTGEFRGILCDKCNKGLGFFDDDEQKLKNAIEYLQYND